MGQPILLIQVVSSSEYHEFLSQSIFEASEEKTWSFHQF